MKTLIGLTLIITGAIFGCYVGVWLCFIGGIVDVIEAIRATDLIAMDVAVGVAKVMFAGVAGGISAVVFILPGKVLID